MKAIFKHSNLTFNDLNAFKDASELMREVYLHACPEQDYVILEICVRDDSIVEVVFKSKEHCTPEQLEIWTDIELSDFLICKTEEKN